MGSSSTPPVLADDRAARAVRQSRPMVGTLDWTPALDRPDLLAAPVAAALAARPDGAA
jgi:hypothetical protein